MKVILSTTSGDLYGSEYKDLLTKIRKYAMIYDRDKDGYVDATELSIATDNVKRLIEDCMQYHEVILGRNYMDGSLLVEIYDYYRE